MCRKEGEFCKTCLGNDCNIKSDVQQCISCTSDTSSQCIRSPQSFPLKKCRKYTDECIVHVANDTVIRGCLDAYHNSDNIEKDCKDGDICEKCSNSNGCNNKVVDGEFCIHCDSEIDFNCKNNVNVTMHRQCKLSVQQLGCYLYNDGGKQYIIYYAHNDENKTFCFHFSTGDIIKRGCLADIDPYEKKMCRNEGEFCKTCIGNDCNIKTNYQKCRVCWSNDTLSCIRTPGSVPTKMCDNYLDECFTHVTNDIVIRGCSSDANQEITTDCANKDICEKCSNGENCNNKIVDGEFCYTCDSENDPHCHENVNISMRTQCKLGVDKLGCYLFYDGGNITKRGCLNDISAYERAMCREQDEFCKTCIGNDCNKKIEFQACRTCSSNSTVSCVRSPGSVPSKICREYADECFVHVSNDTTVRGCLSEMNDQYKDDCKNPDICEKCSNANNCNNKIVDGEFCINCRSVINSGCIDDVTDTMHKQCKLSVSPLGCYLYKDNQSN